VAQGKEVKLVAETLEISRSSLYYRRQPRASRADRSHDEQIIAACGEKPAYGYRRVVWWLGRHHGLVVNGKRALRVMRERGLLVRQRRFQVSRRKDWGKVEAPHPNHVWQSDMTKVWAGPSVGWAYLVSVIDCCTRETSRKDKDFSTKPLKKEEERCERKTATETRDSLRQPGEPIRGLRSQPHTRNGL
jgi:putative transposase